MASRYIDFEESQAMLDAGKRDFSKTPGAFNEELTRLHRTKVR